MNTAGFPVYSSQYCIDTVPVCIYTFVIPEIGYQLYHEIRLDLSTSPCDISAHFLWKGPDSIQEDKNGWLAATHKLDLSIAICQTANDVGSMERATELSLWTLCL